MPLILANGFIVSNKLNLFSFFSGSIDSPLPLVRFNSCFISDLISSFKSFLISSFLPPLLSKSNLLPVKASAKPPNIPVNPLGLSSPINFDLFSISFALLFPPGKRLFFKPKGFLKKPINLVAPRIPTDASNVFKPPPPFPNDGDKPSPCSP